MLVTLYLITINCYSSVKAPSSRGFSYVEKWMIGIQFCILLAIFEYGYILASKKMLPNDDVKKIDPNDRKKIVKEDNRHKTIDLITLAISLTSFLLFNIIYWSLI